MGPRALKTNARSGVRSGVPCPALALLKGRAVQSQVSCIARRRGTQKWLACKKKLLPTLRLEFRYSSGLRFQSTCEVTQLLRAFVVTQPFVRLNTSAEQTFNASTVAVWFFFGRRFIDPKRRRSRREAAAAVVSHIEPRRRIGSRWFPPNPDEDVTKTSIDQQNSSDRVVSYDML